MIDYDMNRKMQHLRREFDKAQLLLQFVMERERLHEASFHIQQEIFDQKIFELTTASEATELPRRKETLFRYELQMQEALLKESFKIESMNGGGSLGRSHSSSSRLSSSQTKKELSKYMTNKLEKSRDHHRSESSGGRRHTNGFLADDGLAGDRVSHGPDEFIDKKKKLSSDSRPRKRKSSSGAGSGGFEEGRVRGVLTESSHPLLPTAANIVDVGSYHQGITSLKIPDAITSLGRLMQWSTQQMSTFLHPLNFRDEVQMTSSRL